MLEFTLKLLKTAAADTLRSMGTTALAVGSTLAIWFAVQVNAGNFSVATANWNFGLSLAALMWLAVLAWHARRRFSPLLHEHRRVFRLLAFNQDQSSDADRLSIWCLLEFCKDLGPIDLLVRVTTFLPHGQTTRVVHTERFQRLSKGEQRRLALGSIRIIRQNRPAFHSIWGSEPGAEVLRPDQVTIMTDTKNTIDISVGSQTHKCYIEFVTPPPGALSPAIYMTADEDSPLLAPSGGRASSDAQWGAVILAGIVFLLATSHFISERRWPFSPPTFASQLTPNAAQSSNSDSNLKDALISDLSGGTLRVWADFPYRPGVTVYVASFTDSREGAQFLGAYIPKTDDTVALAEEIIKQHIDILKRLAPGKNEVQGISKGQYEPESTDQAVFTGRIFIYHEKLLTGRELQSIDDLARAQGVNVVLRSPAWLTR